MNNYQITQPGLFEPWAAVNEVVKDVDPCVDPMDEVLASPELAHFIHYCQISTYWNKYWFGWGSNSSRHVLERCDAGVGDPMLARLLAGTPNSTNRTHLFVPCVMRRFFAAALKRNCPGSSAAAAVDKIAAGFAL